MSDDEPKSRNVFPIVIICAVMLVIFIGAGVFIGLQRAQRDAPARNAQRQAQQQLRNFAEALGGGSQSQGGSFYDIEPTEETVELPGDKPALRFVDAKALAQWMKEIRGQQLTEAEPVLGGVACIQRVETLHIPSEQAPRHSISRHFRTYKVTQPPGTLEMEIDESDQTIINIKFDEGTKGQSD